MKRYLQALLGASAVCLLAWSAGFGFNERGPETFITMVVAVYFAWIGWGI